MQRAATAQRGTSRPPSPRLLLLAPGACCPSLCACPRGRYVHNVSEDVKRLLGASGVEVPLLSPRQHACRPLATATVADDVAPGATAAREKLCRVYEEQVTCASCHAKAVPPTFEDY